MRQSSLLAVLMLTVSTNSFAQLKLHENGKLSLGTNEVPASEVSINTKGYADYYMSIVSEKCGFTNVVKDNPQTTFRWSIGGYFPNRSTNNNFIVGIKGDTHSYPEIERKESRAYGVLGEGGFATNGWNFGLFGRIAGTHNGAGLYATSDAYDNGTCMDARYAGYFNGDTKVNGTLTVNGSINGLILSKAVNETSVMQSSTEGTSEEEQVLPKLRGLQLLTYFKDQPVSLNSVEDDDTIHSAKRMTNIEVQNMSKSHMGLSVSQLEEVYPDLVYTNEDGSKSINYVEMIPLLVRSINELSEIVSNQNTQIKAKMHTADIKQTVSQNAWLGQNTPNPAKGTTSIGMYIPTGTKNAKLGIYNLEGKEIKAISIAERGEQTVYIPCSELNNGLYIYGLIVDGNIVETKRMVVSNQ